MSSNIVLDVYTFLGFQIRDREFLTRILIGAQLNDSWGTTHYLTESFGYYPMAYTYTIELFKTFIPKLDKFRCLSLRKLSRRSKHL